MNFTAPATSSCATAPSMRATSSMPRWDTLPTTTSAATSADRSRRTRSSIFGDFLRVTDHEANTNLGTIPPSSWRTGNLSSGLTLAAPVVVYDPATGNPDGTNRTPFAGNIIPDQPDQPDRAEDSEPGAGSQPGIERIRPEQQLFRTAPVHQGHELVRRQGGRHRLATRAGSAGASATPVR